MSDNSPDTRSDSSRFPSVPEAAAHAPSTAPKQPATNAPFAPFSFTLAPAAPPHAQSIFSPSPSLMTASTSPSSSLAFTPPVLPAAPFTFAPLAPAASSASSPSSLSVFAPFGKQPSFSARPPVPPMAPFSFAPPPSNPNTYPLSGFTFSLAPAPDPPASVSRSLDAHRTSSAPAPQPREPHVPPPAIDPTQPLRPLISPFMVPAPAITCDAALKHAAQDNTELYLSLLPAAVRAEVDHWGVCPGALSLHYNLPAGTKLRSLNHVCYGGKEIAIAETEVVGRARQLGLCLLKIPVTPGDPELRLLFGRNDACMLCDVEGNEIYTWHAPDASRALGDATGAENRYMWEIWSTSVAHSSGWVRCGMQLTNCVAPNVVYEIPPAVCIASGDMDWTVFSNDGAPKLCIIGGEDGSYVGVWDLRSGQRDYDKTASGRCAFTVLPLLGALVYHSARPRCTEIYPLATGTPLLVRETSISGFYATAQMIVLNQTPAHVAANRVVYWTPQTPTRLCSMEFGDWKIVHMQRDVVIARRGDENLFWNLSIGVGVRSDLNILSSADAIASRTGTHWHCNALFVWPDDGRSELHMVPVACAATAPATLPERVPTSVPFARSRLVYRSDDTAFKIGKTSCWTNVSVAPVFVRTFELWTFH